LHLHHRASTPHRIYQHSGSTIRHLSFCNDDGAGPE
jgi:hypothetical protein